MYAVGDSQLFPPFASLISLHAPCYWPCPVCFIHVLCVCPLSLFLSGAVRWGGAGCGVVCVRAEPEMEGLLCDLLWADPSDDPGVTNIESLSDQVQCYD